MQRAFQRLSRSKNVCCIRFASGMLPELVLRFFVGGALVTLFAAVSELFRPRTFAGLFGAAPSVALAMLALTMTEHPPAIAAIEARSMMLGSVATLVYAATCIVVAKQSPGHVWLGATAAWGMWLFVSVLLWRALLGGRLS
jgi:hypothetical protein